jgi:hypothetical protein
LFSVFFLGFSGGRLACCFFNILHPLRCKTSLISVWAYDRPPTSVREMETRKAETAFYCNRAMALPLYFGQSGMHVLSLGREVPRAAHGLRRPWPPLFPHGLTRQSWRGRDHSVISHMHAVKVPQQPRAHARRTGRTFAFCSVATLAPFATCAAPALRRSRPGKRATP